MKCIICFYLLAQIGASYFISLHLPVETFRIYLVLLILASLAYILTSIKDVSLYKSSLATTISPAYTHNKPNRNKK